MSMIFPGMDPYLEDPAIWPGVHTSLIVYIRDQLQPLLRPRYVAMIDERVYVHAPDNRDYIPDVYVKKPRPDALSSAAVVDLDEPVVVQIPGLEVHEAFIEIRERKSNQKVVTAIEVISPSNKYAGAGRDAYLTKQHDVRRSQAHLVEIDLLRYGPHVLAIAESYVRGQGDYDYLISINRAGGLRDRFEYYARTVKQPLPRIRIPLAGADPDVRLDLQAAMTQVHEAGAYRDEIRYDRPCVPPLRPEDQAWADELIRHAFAAPPTA
jgi:hypothetical protein